MDNDVTPDATDDVVTDSDADTAPEVDDDAPDAGDADTSTLDDETRVHVQRLRKEAAGYRTRLRDAEARADDLAGRLHTQMVAATGRLADPSDLAYDVDHLDDPDALNAAIDGLLASKPHLAKRTPAGDIGQGATASG